MDWPRLNPLARPCLLGLCYRALAGPADPAAAPLTQRRIEHVQLAETELLKQLSTARGDAAIFAPRALETRRLAQQAALDLQLFDEAHPPPPAKRGWGKPKRTHAEAQAEAERTDLQRIAAQATSDAQAAEAQATAATARVPELEQELAELRDLRAGYSRELSEQLAAHVLSLGAAGEWAEARTLLADTRKLVRGDLMVATLIALCAMFEHGAAGLREALVELAAVFQQHSGPLPRVLEALAILAGGGTVGVREVGVYQAEQFSLSACYRLYQLVCVLAGWPPERAASGDPFQATLWALGACRGGVDQVTGEAPMPPAEMARWSAGADVVVRVLCAQALARRGEAGLIPQAAGVDLAEIRPPAKRGEEWPSLWTMVSAAPRPAWPAAYHDTWRAALCCHVLVAAQDLAPPALYDKWLSESYGWPKSDLYWWSLSQVKHDPGLLRNLTGGADELFRVGS